MLSEHVVDDPDAPRNFSVKLADAPRNGRSGAFHLLYRGSNLQLRTRDPRRLVSGLVTYLTSFLDLEEPNILRVAGVGLVREGGAVIAPAALRQLRPQVERRLKSVGIRFIDAPWLSVDWEHAEVVVPSAGLQVDWPQLDRLERLVESGPADEPVAPGRYRLKGWAFMSNEEEKLTRAQALAMSIPTVSGHQNVEQRLSALATVMRNVPPVGIEWSTPGLLARSIERVVVARG